MNMDIKILVADDLEAMRMSVCSLLQHFGFTNVAEARDGRHALEILRADAVDLLITDLDMPNMDGFSLLQAIRSDTMLKNLPVIVLTADAEKDSVRQAAQAGANDYLVKPFTVDVLEQKIKNVLG